MSKLRCKLLIYLSMDSKEIFPPCQIGESVLLSYPSDRKTREVRQEEQSSNMKETTTKGDTTKKPILIPQITGMEGHSLLATTLISADNQLSNQSTESMIKPSASSSSLSTFRPLRQERTEDLPLKSPKSSRRQRSPSPIPIKITPASPSSYSGNALPVIKDRNLLASPRSVSPMSLDGEGLPRARNQRHYYPPTLSWADHFFMCLCWCCCFCLVHPKRQGH